MKIGLAFWFSVCASLWSTSLWAWDTFNHMLVAESALSSLEPKVRRAVESESYKLLKQLSTERRLYLRRNFQGASAFAQMSVLADDMKRRPLSAVFAQFQIDLPESLQALAESDTANWHYKNQSYRPAKPLPPGLPAPPACDLQQGENIETAYNRLTAALDDAGSEEQKALILVLLSHFIADAHQPLHAISRVEDDCDHDRGGNRFCLRYRAGSFGCELSLHQYWDSALELFTNNETLADAQLELGGISESEQVSHDLDVSNWLAESYSHARFVYSVKPGSNADRFYIEDGQNIAKKRMLQAASRLAYLIQSRY